MIPSKNANGKNENSNGHHSVLPSELSNSISTADLLGPEAGNDKESYSSRASSVVSLPHICEDPNSTAAEDQQVSFMKSFYSTQFSPSQNKDKLLEELVAELNAVAENRSWEAVSSVLLKLYSIVFYEKTPYVLRQLFALMSGYGSTAPLCSILYRFRANGDCNLLCVRLLLFFFVNSHNRNKHLQFFVASGGVPVLITLLRRFVRKEAIARSYLCELFSLLYLLAQNQYFAFAYADSGGFPVLNDYLDLLDSLPLEDLLDVASKPPTLPARAPAPGSPDALFATVKNLTVYLFSTFSSLARLPPLRPRVARQPALRIATRFLDRLVSLLATPSPVSTPLRTESFPGEPSHALERCGNPASVLSSAAELADAITVGENGLSRTEALRSLYYMVESVEQFLATAMRDVFAQLAFLQARGFAVLARLLAVQREGALFDSCQHCMVILSAFRATCFVGGNTLTKGKIDELLTTLLELLYDDVFFLQRIAVANNAVDVRSLLFDVIDFIAWQCKQSASSRNAIDAELVTHLLILSLQNYGKEAGSHVIDCVLSLVDMNGDNMMTMMMMNVLDVLYPLLSDDLEDEALATKKSMLLAILSSFNGFDDFFAKSDVVDVIKQIMMNYTNNKVIMQNCFLSLYYLSHLPVIRTMDDALFMIVQEYVSQSKNDAGTLQRF
ncbi:hypothetical protein WA588_004255, partial [Blastocystis sp. NMH]